MCVTFHLGKTGTASMRTIAACLCFAATKKTNLTIVTICHAFLSYLLDRSKYDSLKSILNNRIDPSINRSINKEIIAS